MVGSCKPASNVTAFSGKCNAPQPNCNQHNDQVHINAQTGVGGRLYNDRQYNYGTWQAETRTSVFNEEDVGGGTKGLATLVSNVLQRIKERAIGLKRLLLVLPILLLFGATIILCIVFGYSNL